MKRIAPFVIGCILLAFALVLAAIAFSLDSLRDHQVDILRWGCSLASGFAAVSFSGRMAVKMTGPMTGMAISATGGFGVFVLVFFWGFPRSSADLHVTMDAFDGPVLRVTAWNEGRSRAVLNQIEIVAESDSDRMPVLGEVPTLGTYDIDVSGLCKAGDAAVTGKDFNWDVAPNAPPEAFEVSLSSPRLPAEVRIVHARVLAHTGYRDRPVDLGEFSFVLPFGEIINSKEELPPQVREHLAMVSADPGLAEIIRNMPCVSDSEKAPASDF